jgi:hypothetical protein
VRADSLETLKRWGGEIHDAGDTPMTQTGRRFGCSPGMPPKGRVAASWRDGTGRALDTACFQNTEVLP